MGLAQCSRCYGSGMVYEARRDRDGNIIEVHTDCDLCSGSGLMRVNSEYDNEGWQVRKNTYVSRGGFMGTPKR